MIMSFFAATNVTILLTDSLLSLPVLRTLLYDGEKGGKEEKSQSGLICSLIQASFDWY